MTINQALKEKNRLAGKIKVLDARLASNATWIKGNTPSYNYGELLSQREIEVEALVTLKEKISKATVPVVGKILKMSESKALIQALRNTGMQRGRRHEYGLTAPVEYESALTEKERDALVEKYEKDISELQDELDKFNATTEI